MARGGPVMYPLLACSILALTVITERFLFWLNLRRQRDPEGVQRILGLVQEGRVQDSLAQGRRLQDPVARVLVHGLEHWPGSVSGALESQAQEEVRQMRRYLGVLDTVITLAPLLGIYGTITGIIRAFGFLGAAAVPDPRSVASGISEALITTAAGLTIAIFSVPPYNFFSSKTEELVHDVERQATQLELLVQRPAPEEAPPRAPVQRSSPR